MTPTTPTPAASRVRRHRRGGSTAAGQDLLAALRAELAAIEPVRPCCRAALRSALGAAAEGRARSPVVARLAVRLEDAPIAGFSGATARRHCREAWLRGRFLAAGSLSTGESGVHLELWDTPEAAEVLAGDLAAMGLTVSWRLRRGRGVVTIKRTDDVTTLLRWIGASATVLELESRLVTRQLQGHLNRVINAESANLRRSVRAAHRQVEAVRSLRSDGRLARLPAPDREVAMARLEAPEASLTELSAATGIGRSRVQRALERIVALADGPSGPSDGAVRHARDTPAMG
jgi:DNA-binding protein WhiA